MNWTNTRVSRRRVCSLLRACSWRCRDSRVQCTTCLFSTAVLAVLLLTGVQLRAAPLQTYDSTLGALPDSQGWNLVESGTHPAPSVSGGILRQGPTAGPVQFWDSAYATPVNFSTDTITMYARRKVIQSELTFPSGLPRTGYLITVVDSTGQFFLMMIASDHVRLLSSIET